MTTNIYLPLLIQVSIVFLLIHLAAFVSLLTYLSVKKYDISLAYLNYLFRHLIFVCVSGFF